MQEIAPSKINQANFVLNEENDVKNQSTFLSTQWSPEITLISEFNQRRSIPSSAQQLIAELLKLKRFNLTRIALELEISKASTSRILSGKIRNTNTKTFNKLLSLYCSVFFEQKKTIH